MGIFPGSKILLSFIIPSVGHIWDLRETTELETQVICNSEEGTTLYRTNKEKLKAV